MVSGQESGGLRRLEATLPSQETSRRRPTFQPLLALSLFMGASPAVPPPSDTAAKAQAAQAVAGCPHPYFPLEDGLKLTYRVGSSEFLLTTRGVTSSPEGQKATLVVDIKGRHGETEVTCSAEGVSTSLGGLEGALLSTSGMKVEVVAAEGMVVPAPSRMGLGDVWRNSLSVRLQPPESAKLRPILSTTFDKEATVVGEEEVRVEAGTFKALKVRNVTTARSGRQGATGRSIESFVWFAPDVGLIKVETAGRTDLELLRLERPVEARKAAPRKKRPDKT